MTSLHILSFFWPRMTLARFEKAYRAAVVKHGEKNAQVVAGTMKATCEALGLRYVADKQAQEELEKANAEAVRLETENIEAASALAKEVTKMEQEIRAMQDAHAKETGEVRNVIAKHSHRAKQIKNLQSIL